MQIFNQATIDEVYTSEALEIHQGVFDSVVVDFEVLSMDGSSVAVAVEVSQDKSTWVALPAIEALDFDTVGAATLTLGKCQKFVRLVVTPDDECEIKYALSGTFSSATDN